MGRDCAVTQDFIDWGKNVRQNYLNRAISGPCVSYTYSLRRRGERVSTRDRIACPNGKSIADTFSFPYSNTPGDRGNRASGHL